MNKAIKICFISIVLICLDNSTFTQTPEMEQANARVNKILEDSGRYFKDGLVAFKGSRRSEMGQMFDKSVEVFLYSTLNIQKDKRLQSCYTQLIDTVYRMEFPSDAQVPQIRGLSAACGWKWNAADFQLADAVSQMLKPSVQKAGDTATIASAAANPNQAKESLVGFNQQGFEPSPLDELSKLELTTDELQIDNNPVAPAQNQYIQYATKTATIVKAQAGDTLAKLAARYGANPVEVAKYNGLMPNSMLGSGKEIKIPSKYPATSSSSNRATTSPAAKISIGPKPAQIANGRVGIVMNYFNEVLHDPYSMRFVRWSSIIPSSYAGQPCWRVDVKYRAKNLMGAYVLSERVFYIRNNKIIQTLELE